MRLASPYAVVAGVIVAATFVTRAATGVPAAWAFARGRAAQDAGLPSVAAPLLDQGTAGSNTSEGLWRAGQSRLEAWARLSDDDRYGAQGNELLRGAADRFLTARARCPGSAWFGAALGDVYMLRERGARSRRKLDLDTLARGPWGMIGDDARVAIGLIREAVAREPNRFEHRDALVFLLEENGLHDDALRAMAESARTLPDFAAHPEFVFERLSPDLVEAFWRSSRSVVPGDAPLVAAARRSLASGQLGRRLGHLAEAEEDLRAALELPGSSLASAEASYHLGVVLVDRGKYDEAESMFTRALREPVFVAPVAQMRATVLGRQGRWAEALERLRLARRLRPRDAGLLLEFARVAQQAGAWDQADEALRWTILIHPEATEPRRALVELLLAKGDASRARDALDSYVRSLGPSEDTARLEASVARQLDPAPR